MENNNTENFSFNHLNADGVMTTLSFVVPDSGLTIANFHNMCRRFALSLGYSEKNVDKYFGEESFRQLCYLRGRNESSRKIYSKTFSSRL